MEKKSAKVPVTRQQDEKVFRDGEAVYTQDDLRELINTIYTYYQFKGTQYSKFSKLMDFISLETNKFIDPELTIERKKLNDFLDTFKDFLDNNFQKGGSTDDGDILYCFKTEETRSETEAFLIEFQMVSLDVENAFKKYRKAVSERF
jgi:hypothetical protein